MKEKKNDFIQEAEEESLLPILRHTEPVEVPEGMQLIEVEKLRRLVEMAMQFKTVAHHEHDRADELQQDAEAIVNAFVFILEESGLMKLVGKDGEVDQWGMIAKMISMVKKIYRERNNPDNVFRKSGATFVEFLKKYGDPKNFDEQGQFKLPPK